MDQNRNTESNDPNEAIDPINPIEPTELVDPIVPHQPEPSENPEPFTPEPPPSVNPAAPPPPPVGAPPPPPQSPPPPPASEPIKSGSLTNPTKDDRNWAMFAHLSAIVGAFVFSLFTMPFLGFIGPLVIYLIKKDESPFIADQAKEALNFNINVGILLAAFWVLSIALVWTIVVPFLMILLSIAVGITAFVLIIIATMKSSEGIAYRYPLIIRLVN